MTGSFVPRGVIDHLAPAAMHEVLEGPARGTRVIIAEPHGGFHARLLVDRGLDIGRVSVGGEPISWTSPVGEQRPALDDDGEGWHRGWAGGLVTTCGLHNVGAPSEGHGRHGSFSSLPASDVSIVRAMTGETSGSITVRGTMRDGDALDPGLVLEREIVLAVGQPELVVRDVVRNESDRPLQAPILYHVNIGAPFLGPASRVRAGPREAHQSISVDGAPMGMPAAVEDDVVEHLLDGVGANAAVLFDTGRGPRLRIGWDASTQPRLFTWQRRRAGSYVMAVEPANCSVAGRLADREAGEAPFLAPGATRMTTVRIAFESGEDDAEQS